MKIIFMGSPEFASPTLKNIINSNEHEVVAVFTSEPKPKNRGMHITKSPIHIIAEENNIDVYNPSSLKNKEVDQIIQNIEADIVVVVAYGFLVPENILNSKKYGAINLHPSKLPRFRGAAPLQHTIISGDKETSICIIQMDKGLDTGDILLEQHYKLHPKITLKELSDQTSKIGADLIVEVLNNIENIKPQKQSTDNVSYASKLSKEDSMIDWQKAALEIDCMIRGMNPWPGTFFKFNNLNVKILEAEPTNHNHEMVAGTVIAYPLEIACGRYSLIVKQLQVPGKKPISSEEFRKGYNYNIGEILK